MADVLRRSVRPTDLVARYGGEEFLVILGGISPVAALAVAEDLRASIADTLLSADPPVRATISVGVATSLAPDRNAVLKAADRALYQAKEAGRNQVRQSDTGPGATGPYGRSGAEIG